MPSPNIDRNTGDYVHVELGPYPDTPDSPMVRYPFPTLATAMRFAAWHREHQHRTAIVQPLPTGA